MARIVVVSPAPIDGSGGIRTILNYVKALSNQGHEAAVSFLNDGRALATDLTGLVQRYYGVHAIEALVLPDGLKGADLVVATRWDTPRLIRSHFAGLVAHLIQDIEGLFNPIGDAYLMAETNCLYDTHFVTLGHWLSNKLKTDYGEPAFVLDFGYDTSTYSLEIEYRRRPKRIAFICQPDKPRRCARLGLEALGIVKSYFPEYEIVLYGNDIPVNAWYPVTCLGTVPPFILNEVYNSAVVGLCISASNPSRIPFEMTACGLPVIDIYRSNNLYDYTEREGILLAHQSPEAIAEALMMVLRDLPFRNQLSGEAIAASLKRPMIGELSQFVTAVNKILEGKRPETSHDFRPKYQAKAVIAEAYDKQRVRAFCRRQETEFSSHPALTQTQHVSLPLGSGLHNIVSFEQMSQAKTTSDTPPSFAWDTVSFPDGTIQTHPTQDAPTSAMMCGVIPEGVTRIRAIAELASVKSNPMLFAMAVQPTAGDFDTSVSLATDVWESRSGSGWREISPGCQDELEIILPEPSTTALDLHVCTRTRAGENEHYAWCRWLAFTYIFGSNGSARE